MINTLIIGGEGYIGNIVTQTLLDNGYVVTSLDNLIYNNRICVLNKKNHKNYHFVYGDMLNSKTLKPLVKKTDAVVLLAGLVGDPITKKYPEEYALINDQGVKAVIDNCAEKNNE